MELEYGVKIARPAEDFPFDSVETESAFVLLVHLPGEEREGFEIEVSGDGRELRISGGGGESAREHVLARRVRLRQEEEVGRFLRVFRIPEGVDTRGIEAHYDENDEILSVYLPKLVAAPAAGGKIEEIKVEEGREEPEGDPPGESGGGETPVLVEPAEEALMEEETPALEEEMQREEDVTFEGGGGGEEGQRASSPRTPEPPEIDVVPMSPPEKGIEPDLEGEMLPMTPPQQRESEPDSEIFPITPPANPEPEVEVVQTPTPEIRKPELEVSTTSPPPETPEPELEIAGTPPKEDPQPELDVAPTLPPANPEPEVEVVRVPTTENQEPELEDTVTSPPPENPETELEIPGTPTNEDAQTELEITPTPVPANPEREVEDVRTPSPEEEEEEAELDVTAPPEYAEAELELEPSPPPADPEGSKREEEDLVPEGGGCTREASPDCQRQGKDEFAKVANAKLPDTSAATVNLRVGLDEVQASSSSESDDVVDAVLGVGDVDHGGAEEIHDHGGDVFPAADGCLNVGLPAAFD